MTQAKFWPSGSVALTPSYEGTYTRPVSFTNDLSQASCTRVRTCNEQSLKQKKGWELCQNLGQRTGISSIPIHPQTLFILALGLLQLGYDKTVAKRCNSKAQHDYQKEGDAAFWRGHSSCPIIPSIFSWSWSWGWAGPPRGPQ